VTSLKDRQRAAARARLEREMADRQEHATHRRRLQTRIAAGVIGLVVIVGVVVIVAVSGGSSKAKPKAAASAAPASATCAWTPNPNPSASPSQPANKDLVKTGTPPTTGIPNKGTRTMTLDTNQGAVTISLDLAKAPCAAESLTYLAGKKYFDNTTCSDLFTTGPYLLLCGDPSTKPDGGPAYTVATANLPTNKRPNYQAGDVAMYNNGSGDGSQFMIFYKDTPVSTDPSTGAENPAIPSNYTVVGSVTGGMNVVQKVAAGGAKTPDATTGASLPKLPVTFKSVTVGAVQGGAAS